VGTQPIHFQWYKDGIMIPGKTYPNLGIADSDSSSEGRYHCEIRNACAIIQSDTVQLYLAPQICMVTVDTATAKNMVVWEKKSTAPIESYNIYRESIVAGEYDPIGNVAVNSLSEFVDTMVNPAAQANIYKITALTSDGQESDIDLCQPHKTMHLLTSRNLEYNVPQLDWDYYYGFDYGTFYIYRFDSSGALFDTIAKSSSSTTWLDEFAVPGAKYFYRVAVQSPQPCTPTGSSKAGTGPYSHSLSNLDDNKLKSTVGLEEIIAGSLKIYPNPFSERTTVEFPNMQMSEYSVFVRDLSGKAVLTEVTRSNRVVIERRDLSPGIYFIEIRGEKIYRDRLVIQ
ncbi:hypothetical protein LCGC14_3083660, partial [marine sediment metagenome]